MAAAPLGAMALSKSSPPAFRLSYPSPVHAGYALALLIFATLVAYVDRQIFALLVEPIKRSFSLTDTQLGLLQGVALNLCFGLASLPMGVLVDRTNRVRLVALSVSCWTACTFATALSTGFWSLFLCRMGVGLAEAGLVPAAYSLIGDLYAERLRTNAILVFYCAIYIGASAAIFVGGAMIGAIPMIEPRFPSGLDHWEVWRLAFIGAGLPGILVALAFCVLKEPVRHNVTETASDSTETVSLFAYLSNNRRTVVCLCWGLVAVSIGVDAFLMWMPAIFVRAFGFSEGNAGKTFGLLLCAGSLAGAALAGVLASGLRRRSPMLAPLQVLRLGALASALTLPVMIVGRDVGVLVTISLIYMTFAYAASAVGPSLLTAIAPNHLRGQIFSIWVAATVIAACLWPALIGALSDQVFHGPFGLLESMLCVAVPSAFLAVGLLAWIVRPYKRTLAALAPPESRNGSSGKYDDITAEEA